MAANDGVRLQLSQVEVKPSSGRETPATSFGDTLKSGMATTANVVGGTVQTAGYYIPGAAVVSAAINGAGMVRGSQGSNGVVNGGGMTMAGMGGNAMGGMGMGMGMGGMGMVESVGGGAGMSTAAFAAGQNNVMSSGQYSGYMGNVAARAQGGDQASQMMMATQQMQEMNQAFNMQYLQLQEGMQTEGRQFTALSNVMKAKNDSAKNTLSNLK